VELGTKHAALAELVGRRGKLRDVTADGATLRFKNLSDPERVLVEDRRNRSAVTRALEKAAGRSFPVQWSLPKTAAASDPEKAAPSRATPTEERSSPGKSAPRKKDEFSQKVADLFDGVIEELP
jgi:hypothetical protein